MVGETDQELEEVQELGALSPTKGSKAIPASVSIACWEESHHADNRELASMANQAPCGQLAFTSTSTFIPSMPTGQLRSQHLPLGSEALTCTILANKAAQAASPEGRELGYFPTETGASGWRWRMQPLAGPPSVAICWCGCSLLMFPKASCQGGAAWRMQRWGGRLWSPGSKRFPHQGWKGPFVHKIF